MRSRWVIISCFCISTIGFAQSGDESVVGQARGRLQEIRDEIREWDQSVRGFRSDHQFVLSLGPTSGQWRFKRFGSLTNETYQTSGYFSKFQYSFHLPIAGGFGYYLGTSAGYHQETETPDELEIISSTMLPGVLAGFVYNFSPGWRFLTGIDFYLERWNGLGERDDEGEDPTISVTARTLDAFLALDVFYRLKWAMRFEAHRRQGNYREVNDSTGYSVDARIQRDDQWIGVGLLYHLM